MVFGEYRNWKIISEWKILEFQKLEIRLIYFDMRRIKKIGNSFRFNKIYALDN